MNNKKLITGIRVGTASAIDAKNTRFLCNICWYLKKINKINQLLFIISLNEMKTNISLRNKNRNYHNYFVLGNYTTD